ncbi:Zinc finger protein, partial [Pseudolycoriella hygida]
MDVVWIKTEIDDGDIRNEVAVGKTEPQFVVYLSKKFVTCKRLASKNKQNGVTTNKQREGPPGTMDVVWIKTEIDDGDIRNEVAVGKTEPQVDTGEPKDLNVKSEIAGEYANFECSSSGRSTETKNEESTLNHNTRSNKFICDECGKRFNRKAFLERHMLTHRDKKSFACDVCDMQFAQKCYFERHKRSHTGEKPFSCDVCDSKFARKASLQIHQRTHTESDDGREFEDKFNVETQEQMFVDDEEPFDCNETEIHSQMFLRDPSPSTDVNPIKLEET